MFALHILEEIILRMLKLLNTNAHVSFAYP